MIVERQTVWDRSNRKHFNIKISYMLCKSIEKATKISVGHVVEEIHLRFFSSTIRRQYHNHAQSAMVKERDKWRNYMPVRKRKRCMCSNVLNFRNS